jgi:hypothetical protein
VKTSVSAHAQQEGVAGQFMQVEHACASAQVARLFYEPNYSRIELAARIAEGNNIGSEQVLQPAPAVFDLAPGLRVRQVLQPQIVYSVCSNLEIVRELHNFIVPHELAFWVVTWKVECSLEPILSQ